MPDVVRLPAQDQKSMLACGSVVAVQNSVTLPSRTWATLATGISIDFGRSGGQRGFRASARFRRT